MTGLGGAIPFCLVPWTLTLAAQVRMLVGNAGWLLHLLADLDNRALSVWFRMRSMND